MIFRFLTAFMAGILLFSTVCAQTSSAAVRLHFINVGYGNATLIEFPDASTMLIDAGGELHAASLLTYLKSMAVTQIDTAVITHPHKNHFEGFAAILQHLPLKRVYINGDERAEEGYAELLQGFNREQIPVEVLAAPDQIPNLPADIELKALHPYKDVSLRTPNGQSLVTLLTYKETSFLFFADVEPEEQDELIVWEPGIDHADVILVPHHGGPLSGHFLEVFKDKIFIVSTGHNDWNNPGADDYKKLQGEIYRTDQCGTIVIETNGEDVRVKPQNP